MPPRAPPQQIIVEGVSYPREVQVPEGLEEELGGRWFGRETVYQSGAMVNQPYTRWYSRDGRHKSALSPNKMIALDCEDRGIDHLPVLQRYKEWMERRKAEEAEERRIAQENSGVLKGERREAAIAVFEAKYGELKGPVVHQFPGWVTRWDLAPNSGQVHVAYIEPSGQKWLLLKDLMARFGAQMQAGEDISDIIETGKANQNASVFSEGAVAARAEGTYTYTQDGAPPAKLEREHKKRAHKSEIFQAKSRRVIDACNVASAEDFVERETLALVQLPLQEGNAEAATAKLKDAGAPDAAGLATSGVDLHALLQLRGFDSSTEVLAIFDKSAGEGAQSEHPLLGLAVGLYYNLCDDLSGKPIYQKMLKAGEDAPQASSGIVCQGLYICWSDVRRCWKLSGGLDQSKAGYAACVAECPRPADAAVPWSLLRADFPGLQKAGE